ncbi:MAG TPA: hypothetical protein VL404_01155 [Candidatus Eisenbacteria bacterium]|nr:hypothetical protein [Candidatus Eisenbacteria bacterium]
MKAPRIAALLAACLFFAAPSFASMRKLSDAPVPRLIQPTDRAQLTAEGIRFRWSAEGNSSAEYYDFRLYEGVQAVESGLILKERVPRDRSEWIVPADKFKPGQTYAWTVRQVGTRRSKPGYSIFKVAS